MDEDTDDDLDAVFRPATNDSTPDIVSDHARPPKRKAPPSIVGRRPKRVQAALSKPRKKKSEQQDDGQDTELPPYVRRRRDRFTEKRSCLDLKALLVPPSFEKVYVDGDDRLAKLEQRPDFKDNAPPRPYEDIEMKSSAGTIPAPIAQWLRPYQIEGAKFLHQAFVYQRGVILGDDMGLGKTIQVISFLTAAFGKTGDERDGKRMRALKRHRPDRWYPRVLLVVPGGLLANWQNELARWGWWQVYGYHGSSKDDAIRAAQAGVLEIMITTYATYRDNNAEVNSVEWDCVIADECHIIKDKKAKITAAMNEVNALCRIGLTGTAIQNNYDELWTLLNWSNPGQFGSLSVWQNNISVPLRAGQSHTATVAQLAKARQTATQLVTQLLPKVFLRRMKTLIADQLPKKSDKIVFCPLTETQLDAYNNFCDSEQMQTIRAGDLDADARAFVFPALVQLQKLSNHLGLLVPGIDADPDKHERELDMLKEAVPTNWERMYAQRDSIHNWANQEYCGKWRVLKKMLKLWHENGDKVLVFSHSVRLLKMLHALFQSKTSYTVSFLAGSMSYEERQRTVDEYNSSPDRFVFLISTRAGGIGLNITSANKVVVMDPNWNPAWDLQAQDRAYRIGQTRDVDVFRLVSVGTIEEIVYARQIYKQQQANIGYTATAERRYFKGVQDDTKQKGEIFGLQNLFAPPGERIALRDIVHKTNVAETKAGVQVAGLDMEAVQESSDDETSLRDETQALSDLAASIIDQAGQRKRKAKQTPKGKDPIHAILASVGVKYTHENAEVIGTSKIEMQISSRAQKAKGDIAWGQEAAFGAAHESQSQVPVQLDDAATERTSNGQRYSYHPPEDVRRRQFCSMAKWHGFDNPSEFAMIVEGWTQEKRRKFLDDFYADRRRVLAKTIEL